MAWLPVTVDRKVRFLAWATLVAQTGIVATGGAVRLTASGLGCPTWPRCTEESFVNTPEMGIHGVIEFGNRLLTFVLVIIAIAAFLAVLRMRRERPELFRLTLAIGLGIPLQAVIGGISVLTQLNPWVVGLHFIVSAGLVALSTVFVWRVRYGQRGARLPAPRWLAPLAQVTSLFVLVTVVAGIITTGSGPHAGDSGAARNGLDSELLQHVHSWPAYILFGLTILLVVGAWGVPQVRRFAIVLLGVEFVQIAVGLAQSRMGLPELLVGIHMVLACVLVAAMTAVLLSFRSRQARPPG